MPQLKCWIDGCTTPRVKWGMCSPHYDEWVERHPPKKTRLFGKSDQYRFFFYVDRGSVDECWIWSGGLTSYGYGQFVINGPEKRTVKAHRYAYELFRGNITDDCELDHLCRMRPCVNPWHLEAVAQRVNSLRGISLPAQNARKTHCPEGHEYTPENTYTNDKGWRVCRTCSLRNAKEWREQSGYKDRRRETYRPRTGVRGKGQYLAARTHCKEGHPLEGDNLIQEKRGDRIVRRCRTCVNAKARKNHAKRKLGT